MAAPSSRGLGIAKSLESPPPPSDSQNRIVIKDTNLSLLVKDVTAVQKQIEETAVSLGGFLVDSYLSRPEFGASGRIVVRVPADKRTSALDSIKGLSLKVVSENIIGTDVTDEYQDVESRLAVLNNTKAKFQAILDQASRVTDLLEVQRELINLQSQIDALKGQQKYLEQSAKLAKISVELATDEIALPYTPDQSWRPSVIFKQAVRSLVANIRSLGTAVIWLVVYLPIIIPIIFLIWWLRRQYK